jgi:diguanylate cyclase (GGDEF)-like protein
MAGTLRSRNRRNLDDTQMPTDSLGPPMIETSEPSGDLEIYSKEVLDILISDNLPPTPNNFSLYFDRLLEEKNEILRKQILSILELEESNDEESTIVLERSLKQGFSSVKNILTLTANLYKNMNLMIKILEKRKGELISTKDSEATLNIIGILDGDIGKLNTILKKQNSQIKALYDETAGIVKNVENETIFDNKFGVYNKRYLMNKIEQEMGLIREFNHKSSLIMIELSRELIQTVENQKAITLMTRTIARLLLKTSRRSDVVSYYGNGQFAMLLKHTDISSAKKASERLCDLVANSNFFLADREIRLKISIGITDIDTYYSVEETIVNAMDGMEKAYAKKNIDYAVSIREKSVFKEKK